jgi:tetratricopeptide (TPR) repeat protein
MRTTTILVGALLLASVSVAQPITPELGREAQRRYKAGVELMSAEKFEEAAEEFRAAIAIDRLMAMAHYNLGQCRMAQKRFVEAVQAYQGSREAFEGIALLSQKEQGERERARRDEINELKNDLIRLQSLKGASAQTAVGMEDRLRTLESMQNRDMAGGSKVPAEVYLALGSAYFRQEKLADAEREYREAVRINKKLGAAHNNLAVIYLLTGRPDEAETAAREAERNGFRVNPRLKDDIKAAKQKG